MFAIRFLPGFMLFAMSAAAVVAPPATAAAPQEVVLLDQRVRVSAREFRRAEDAAAFVNRLQPGAMVIRVCAATAEREVIRFQRALTDGHQRGLTIQRLPMKAVECSWKGGAATTSSL